MIRNCCLRPAQFRRDSRHRGGYRGLVGGAVDGGGGKAGDFGFDFFSLLANAACGRLAQARQALLAALGDAPRLRGRRRP